MIFLHFMQNVLQFLTYTTQVRMSARMLKMPEQPEYRGTIIVDATILRGLSAPIPDKYLNGNHTLHTYLGFLPFLANEGYHIIIPEMVSVEIGNTLANGDCVGKRLQNERFAGTDQFIRPFLQNAAFGGLPNIEIIPNTGPSFVDDYCKAVTNALQSSAKVYNANLTADNRLSRKEKGPFAKKVSTSALASELNTIQASKLDYDYGDEAIKSLLGNDKIKDADNIFVLTDDIDLTKAITTQFPKVKTVTTRCLIYSLADSKLHALAGIEKASGSIDLENSRRSYLNMHKDPAVQHKIQKNGGIIDQNDSDTYSKKIKNNHFSQKMQKLAEELEIKAAQAEDTPAHNEHGRVSAFQKKFGRWTVGSRNNASQENYR